jgi:hypothetical protein
MFLMLVFVNRLEQRFVLADKYDGVYVVTGGVLNPSLIEQNVLLFQNIFISILDDNGGIK